VITWAEHCVGEIILGWGKFIKSLTPRRIFSYTIIVRAFSERVALLATVTYFPPNLHTWCGGLYQKSTCPPLLGGTCCTGSDVCTCSTCPCGTSVDWCAHGHGTDSYGGTETFTLAKTSPARVKTCGSFERSRG
jgi:hypothetical protein